MSAAILPAPGGPLAAGPGPDRGAPGHADCPSGTTSEAVGFDASRAWRLSLRVAVRPEPFGALLYDFGTRKLSFLKNLTVVGVVRSLHDHPSAHAALTAAGVDGGARPGYLRALAALARSGMIVPATNQE